MTTPIDGGQIHPCEIRCGGVPIGWTTGMSLRDWFAGMALQGMLVNGWMPEQAEQNHFKRFDYTRAAYKMADAMLKERENLNTTSPGGDPV